MEQTYNHKTTDKKRTIPKNIRQIGKIEDGLKIYVEDYVKTYMKQLSEEELSENPTAVLVGEYQRTQEERSVFIYGAIRLEQIWDADKIVFTEDTWTGVYEMIKKYFPEAEIAGWFVCGNDFRDDRAEMLKNTHLDNFAGKDKLLYLYDITEKEEQFYKYEEGTMIPIPGYFIYYEKNEEMQGYLVDHRPPKKAEIFVEDRAVREFRTHTSMWQEQINSEANRKKTKKENAMAIRRIMYLAGSMLTLVVLVIGITAVRNQEKMKGLEETIHNITQSFQKEDDSKKDKNIFGEENENISGGNLTVLQSDKENKDNLSVEASSSGLQEKDLIENSSITPNPTDITPTNTPSPTETPSPTDIIPTNTPSPTEMPEEKETTDTSIPPLTGEDVFIYTVKQGDTLVGICKKLYGSTSKLEFIKNMNQIINEDKIYVCQQIVVPNME